MDLHEFKKQYIREELEINEDYGNIFTFIDFANVNKWFENDEQDWNNKLLADDKKISIDLKKLKLFTNIFSKRVRIYYGEDSKSSGSLEFIYKMRKIFEEKNTQTKDLQRIKHYFDSDNEKPIKHVKIDKGGKNYVEIRKCNFDVEISVDAIKMMKYYDAFCIFSGDADFVYLNNFLKKKHKKIILVKAGYITDKLRKSSDLIINAQNIKKHIARIEQKPD